ncbi:MAG: NAD(P)/FAD-dependent oxidoreductase [Deinococcota bacterium]
MAQPTVVIIGAGFAGLNAAKALKHVPVNVLMIDQNNYHTFQPLLYQVATSGLEAGDVAHQVRATFQTQTNFRFRQGTVTGVDWDAQEILLSGDQRVSFDYLIVAAGAIYNDFGVPGVKEHGFFLKSLSEAVNIRSHVLKQFERVNSYPELVGEGALNFVIVGGGPTGVEMAGALAELFDLVMPRDFPQVNVFEARVILVEHAERILGPYTPELSHYTERVLRQRGIDLRLETSVDKVFADHVNLSDGTSIPCNTLIWAAGVRAHPLVEMLGVELTRGYRAVVNQDLSIPDRPNAFIVGDMSGVTDLDGNLYPQVAQVAIQQGKHAVKQIVHQLKGRPTETFKYLDLGNMATIGRSAGIAELSDLFFNLKFKGRLAWLAWLFLHLMYLVGHQNRVNVFANWVYNYFTYDRHARLITEMRPSPGELTNKTGQIAAD